VVAGALDGQGQVAQDVSRSEPGEAVRGRGLKQEPGRPQVCGADDALPGAHVRVQPDRAAGDGDSKCVGAAVADLGGVAGGEEEAADARRRASSSTRNGTR